MWTNGRAPASHFCVAAEIAFKDDFDDYTAYARDATLVMLVQGLIVMAIPAMRRAVFGTPCIRPAEWRKY